MEYREIKELGELLKWRREVIEHVFGETPSDSLMHANAEYYVRHIADGTHFAIVASQSGEEIGCGGVCFSEELPSPDNPSGRCGYLMNIYVREPYRCHGAAHGIVNFLVDKARAMGCGKIYLETTPEGRPVYASLGFRDMPDMMKYHEKET